MSTQTGQKTATIAADQASTTTRAAPGRPKAAIRPSTASLVRAAARLPANFGPTRYASRGPATSGNASAAAQHFCFELIEAIVQAPRVAVAVWKEIMASPGELWKESGK